MRPWPLTTQTFVTQFRLACILSGQGNTAMIANKTADKGGVTPTRATKTKFVIDLRTTGQAAWRIDKPQCGLEHRRHFTLTGHKTSLRNDYSERANGRRHSHFGAAIWVEIALNTCGLVGMSRRHLRPQTDFSKIDVYTNTNMSWSNGTTRKPAYARRQQSGSKARIRR